jgi:hypothetical protein
VLRYNVQRGVAVMPSASVPAPELAAVLSFRIGYAQKVLLDTMECGRRVLQPTAGCHFTEE